MLERKLSKYQENDDYFIETFNDNQIGIPLKKCGHTFNFTSSKIDASEVISCYRQNINTKLLEKLGNVVSNYESQFFVELESESKYSYIGTSEVIKRFTMWIDDFSKAEHSFPHIKLVPVSHDENSGCSVFGFGLYLKACDFSRIREDFLSGRYNYVNISFATPFDCDLVFSPQLQIHYPSDYCLQSLKLDRKQYGKVVCQYPNKILPTTFHRYDSGIVPYSNQPITEFDLRLGATINSEKIHHSMDPNVQSILEWMTDEHLTSFDHIPFKLDHADNP